MLKKIFLTILLFVLLNNYNISSFANNSNQYPCFINNKLIYLNDNEKPFKLISTMDPKADKIILMFPIKNFFKNLGFSVSWIEKERKILVLKNNMKIEFFIDEKDEKKMVKINNHYITLYFRSDLKGKNISIKNGIAFTDLDFLLNWLYGTGTYICEEKNNVVTNKGFSLQISNGSFVYSDRNINRMFRDSTAKPFKISYKPKGLDSISIFCQSLPINCSELDGDEGLYENVPVIYINNQLLGIQKNEAPYIKKAVNNAIIMVPLQRIAEYVNCNFYFDKDKKTIILSKGENTVEISLLEKKVVNFIGDYSMKNTGHMTIDMKNDVIFVDFDFLIRFLNGVYYYWQTPSNKITSYISF